MACVGSMKSVERIRSCAEGRGLRVSTLRYDDILGRVTFAGSLMKADLGSQTVREREARTYTRTV